MPIPLTQEREEERGFNQVEELLDSAAVPYISILLKKESVDRRKQSEKTKEERLKTKQPFVIKNDCLDMLQGKKILIVDDVYTTGRTIYWAAHLLKQHNAKEVRGFSLAR